MKTQRKQLLAKLITFSMMCMVPVSINAAGFSAITSGGVIDDTLDVKVTGHDSDDNGILLSGRNNLVVNNGGTIRVNTVANASGITAADSFSGATNVTVNGAKFTIDVGYAKQGASAVGVWSQTMRNQVGEGSQPQPEYQGGKVTLNALENKINVTSHRVGYGLLSGSDFDGNSNQGGNIICHGKLDIDVNVLTPDGKILIAIILTEPWVLLLMAVIPISIMTPIFISNLKQMVATVKKWPVYIPAMMVTLMAALTVLLLYVQRVLVRLPVSPTALMMLLPK